MFYRAIGYAVWKMAMAYLRQRYAHVRKPAAALTVATAIAVIYVVTRDNE